MCVSFQVCITAIVDTRHLINADIVCFIGNANSKLPSSTTMSKSKNESLNSLSVVLSRINSGGYMCLAILSPFRVYLYYPSI